MAADDVKHVLIEVGALLPLTSDEVVYDALIAVNDGRIVYAGPRNGAPNNYRGAEVIQGTGWCGHAGLRGHAHTRRRPFLGNLWTTKTSSRLFMSSGFRWRRPTTLS